MERRDGGGNPRRALLPVSDRIVILIRSTRDGPNAAPALRVPGEAAQQARLRIDTELTAHEARLEREGAHAAEKVSQAEQEAAAIRSEAEKGAAMILEDAR